MATTLEVGPMLSTPPGHQAAVRQGTCMHCHRTFRRKEHLERHLRTREATPASLQDLTFVMIKPS